MSHNATTAANGMRETLIGIVLSIAIPQATFGPHAYDAPHTTRVTMDLPFTSSEFFEVMAAYNMAVWPAQVALELSAVAVVWLVFRRVASSGVWVSAILTLLWTWTGLAYHWAFFTGINKAAWAFGALCLAGAASFIWFGVTQRRIEVSFELGRRGLVGWLLVAFALVLYPALGAVVGHHYPAVPTFGLPCPTTIFTVGVLLLMGPDTSRWVYVAPLIWSAVGASAAFLLGMYQDLGLVASGLAAAWAMFYRTGKASSLPATR